MFKEDFIMKAIDAKLTKFLNTDVHYFVPIYQRKYCWGKENCLKLIVDIEKIAQDNSRPCHFIGSFIYLSKSAENHASAVKEYQVIDGQQRLTTLSIILLALCDYANEKNNEAQQLLSNLSYESICNKYFYNKDATGDTYFKVKLNEEDFYAWKKLLENRKKPDDIKNSKIFDNYNIILKRFHDKKIDPQLIMNGFEKLVIVDICLKQEDNAQLVFETVNSTGLPLSTADKIRNFLLMTVDIKNQSNLYKNYWHKMETSLNMDSGDTKSFENFFNYFLTLTLKKQLNGEPYSLFKDYYQNVHKSSDEIIKEIYHYSKLYNKWMNANGNGNQIDNLLFKIRKTEQLKVTSVILKLLYDFDNKEISNNDVLEILKMIESYFMRRMVCALPTNSCGSACISMLKSLYNQNKLQSFKKTISNLTYAQRMPKDNEIKTSLKTLQLYSINPLRTKMILDALENYKRKEPINTNEYTIEHIMPQTLSTDWETDLGLDAKRIHETYLNTIGNLTLTGYNSEYKNKRFVDKKHCVDNEGNSIGYNYTPIKISQYLKNVDSWGEKEILSRSDYISDIVIKKWIYVSN